MRAVGREIALADGRQARQKRQAGPCGRVWPRFQVQWHDREIENRRSSRWAAEQPERFAAASFVVGTQTLLGALAVKHAHLCAACLVRHPLVIDEMHAGESP